MRNVFKLASGKWRFECLLKGKLYRKTFKTKTEAEAYKRNFDSAGKFDLAFFLDLPPSSISDIKNALAILPKDKTLEESVKLAWQFYSSRDLSKLADDYIDLKKQKYAAGKLCSDELRHIIGRINLFKAAFKSFDALSPHSLKDFLLAKGSAKTVKNWRGTLSEFFDYCVMQKAIRSNPLNELHSDEFNLAPTSLREIGFLPVETAKAFMAFLEGNYPQFCRFYALTMFAGIRVAEAPRLKDEYFRYGEKKIVFPAKIGKIKKAWTLEDLPDNLWAWLEKYKNTPIQAPSTYERTNSFKQFNLPHNFTRHSFATYHLSLYFDPAKTSKITRNSEQMLRDHYWGALVEKDIAKEYFQILPNCKSKTENS